MNSKHYFFLRAFLTMVFLTSCMPQGKEQINPNTCGEGNLVDPSNYEVYSIPIDSPPGLPSESQTGTRTIHVQPVVLDINKGMDIPFFDRGYGDDSGFEVKITTRPTLGVPLPLNETPQINDGRLQTPGEWENAYDPGFDITGIGLAGHVGDKQAGKYIDTKRNKYQFCYESNPNNRFKIDLYIRGKER